MAVKRAKIIEPADLEKILKMLKRESKEYTRDYVALLLGLKAGLRASEIAGLRWNDVQKANGDISDTIHIGSHLAKGGKERSVPMHKEIKESLIKLRAERPSDEFIRYGDYKPTTTANAMTVWLHRKLKEAGLQGCSSHSLRRTFITNAARRANLHNASLRDVQMLVGHSHLSTTERYIDFSDGVKDLVGSI